MKQTLLGHPDSEVGCTFEDYRGYCDDLIELAEDPHWDYNPLTFEDWRRLMRNDYAEEQEETQGTCDCCGKFSFGAFFAVTEWPDGPSKEAEEAGNYKALWYCQSCYEEEFVL